MLSRLASSRFRGLLIAIVFLAVTLRLGWSLPRPTDHASLEALPDQTEYLALAENLLAGKGLFFYDQRFGQNVYAYRMPLYPAFIAVLGAKITLVRIAQSLLDASVVVAIAGLTLAVVRRPGRYAAALVAGLLVACNPYLIYFCALILSETLFTAMLVWGLLILLIGAQGGRLYPAADANDYRSLRGTLLWLGGGLLLAASALVRPSAGGLAVVLGIAVSFAARPMSRSVASFRPQWPLPVGATMVLLTALVLLPWAYRNSKVVGAWVWTTTNSGVTAYDGFNPDADGSSNQSVLSKLPQLPQMNEVDRSSYLSSRALQYARQHRDRMLDLALAKAGRTWSPVPLSDQFGSTLHRVIGLGYGAPFFLMVILGLLTAPVRRSAKVLLAAPALYFTVVHMASVGSLRYRVPVEPILAVLAGSLLAAFTLSGGPADSPGWKRAGDEKIVT